MQFRIPFDRPGSRPRLRRQRALKFLLAAAVVLSAAAVFAPRPAQAAPGYSILHTFNAYSDGVNPASQCPLVLGTDGNFYGTTQNQGTNGDGTVYRVTPAGVATTLHSFTDSGGDGATPIGSLAIDSNGNLYGATENGGTTNGGTIFEISESGASYTVLYTFNTSDSYQPYTGLVYSSGYLYGATYSGGTDNYGTIFKISTSGSGYTDLAQILTTSPNNGYQISAPLVVSGSTIYGVAQYGGADGYGTVFSLTTSGGSYQTLYAFNPSGSYSGYEPAGLLLGKDGNLYGTTTAGGANGNGSVFAYKVGSSAISDLHDFDNTDDGYDPQAGLAQNSSSGLLYGTTSYGAANNYGVAYQISTSGSFTVLQQLTSAENSQGYGSPPTVSGSAIYDTAYRGGNFGNGSVYKVTLSSPSALSVVHDFYNGLSDGLNPSYGDLLVGSDGELHGTTAYISYGGSVGTAYHIATTGTGYTQDAQVDGSPYGALIQAADGSYVGTTYNGGTYSAGTVFSFTSGDTDSYEDDYDFGEAAGANLPAAMILGSDGNYYGVSYYGGRHNYGCIFKLTPGGYETVLYSFTNGADSGYPMGALVEDSSGNFYGTTSGGGSTAPYGTVFKLSPTYQLRTLLTFDYNTTGSDPQAGVILSGNTLYGTTYSGGATNGGTVYSVSTSGTSPTIIHTFGTNGTDGYYPYAGVTLGTNGKLYGTTNTGGANSAGIVYTMTTSGSETILHSFDNNGTDGYFPYDGVTEAPDGNFYGTTYNGGITPANEPGDNIQGIIYQVQTLLPIVTKVSPASGSVGTSVTLTGVNLSGATSVEFDGTSATISSDSASSLVVTVPSGATTGAIKVTTANGVFDTPTFAILGSPSAVTLSPTSVIGGQANSTGTVTLAAVAPSGGSTITLSSSNTSAATVPSSVTVAAGATTATFTATSLTVASTATVTISASGAGTTKTATLTVVPAPANSSVTLNPTSVTGGSSGTSTGTVTLAAAAPAGGATVTLASSNTAAATVPASVTIAAGATSATFTVSTSAVTAETSVKITATIGSSSNSATLTVNPAASSGLKSVTLSPTSTEGGTSTTANRVYWNGNAPANETVTLKSSNTAVATVPSTVTISSGSSSHTFTITTKSVTSTQPVTITATAGGVTQTATLTVTP